ncbi:MAG: hypothetical protein Q8O67_13995 [Deltaproteobacteria bacterium]|nr:hypothetical protein [Deltaproteobacteria bacterium]
MSMILRTPTAPGPGFLAALVIGVLALATATPAAEPASTTTTTTAALKHPKGARCDACHTPGGWKPAKFAHQATSFPLVGRHAGVACTSCHQRDWSEPVPQGCAGCHVDPHAQEFGLLCRSCHTEEGWQPLFLVDAHRRTQFPLSGRHATLPCEECHVEKRERTFTRTALACTSCHARDAARASATTLDHRALSSSCQLCHVPTSFSPARLAEHESCFPLAGTVHAPVRCAECHSANAIVGARISGACRGVAVRCADCHAHAKGISDRQHRDVVGYAHASEKCAGCHQAIR